MTALYRNENKTMHKYANPRKFAALTDPLMPFLGVGTVALLLAGLFFALIASPPDYQHGDTVRIMYIHVPAAWMGLFVYAGMAVAGGAALIWRHPLSALYVKAVAPIGALFTGLCLVTGMIWGVPGWGTFWVWDARLTSVLILFFLYLGYMALVDAFDNPERGEQAGSLLALIGVVILPVIKFSVDWWNTLHQTASLSSPERLANPGIATEMMTPLLLMFFAFLLGFSYLALHRLKTELLARKIRAREMQDIHDAIRFEQAEQNSHEVQ